MTLIIFCWARCSSVIVAEGGGDMYFCWMKNTSPSSSGRMLIESIWPSIGTEKPLPSGMNRSLREIGQEQPFAAGDRLEDAEERRLVAGS